MQEHYYLWKLKFVKGEKIKKKNIDKYDRDNIFYSSWSGEYTYVPKVQLSDEEIDRLLKLRKAYNFKLLTDCAVWITIGIVIYLVFNT